MVHLRFQRGARAALLSCVVQAIMCSRVVLQGQRRHQKRSCERHLACPRETTSTSGSGGGRSHKPAAAQVWACAWIRSVEASDGGSSRFRVRFTAAGLQWQCCTKALTVVQHLCMFSLFNLLMVMR